MRNLLIIVTLLVLGSCTGGEDSIFHNLPEKGWAYTDTVSFPDVTGSGELSVAVRHDAIYPYSNLWLEVSVVDPMRRTMMRDTVDMRLCDNYGRWLGKGFGGSYQMEVPVGKRVSIDSATTVTVRHIMRVDTLRGLDQIGVSIR